MGVGEFLHQNVCKVGLLSSTFRPLLWQTPL